MEHAASVARTFLTADAVVVDIKEPLPPLPLRRMRKPMPTSGNKLDLQQLCSGLVGKLLYLTDFEQTHLSFVHAGLGPIPPSDYSF